MPAGRALFGAGKGGGFTPLDLGAKLIGYWDPKLHLANSGGLVTAYNDQSGNGNHLSIGAVAPGYNATAFGAGKPGLTFAQSEYMIKASMTTSGTSQLGAASIVSMTDPTGNDARVLSLSQAGGGAADYSSVLYAAPLLRNVVANGLYAYRNGAMSSGAISLSTRVEAISEFNGTTHVLTINGTDQTPVASTGTFAASHNFTLGAELESGSYFSLWRGLIGPVILYNATLSGPEKTNLIAWLAAW